MKRAWTAAVLAGTALVVLGGCTIADEPPAQGGEPGTWELLDPDSVTAGTTVLHLGVTRVDCSSGVTGKVLEPKVTYEPTRIVIETDVEALNLKEATCPGNPPVRVRLQLSEPIGDRDLVDGYCVSGEGHHTSFCFTAVRRPGR